MLSFPEFSAYKGKHKKVPFWTGMLNISKPLSVGTGARISFPIVLRQNIRAQTDQNTKYLLAGKSEENVEIRQIIPEGQDRGSYQVQMCEKHFCVFKVKTKLNKGQDMDYHNTWFDLSHTHKKMEWSGIFVENNFVRICRNTFEKALLRVGAGGRISFPRSISTRKSEAVRTSGSTMYYRHLHHCHHRRHHHNPCHQKRKHHQYTN